MKHHASPDFWARYRRLPNEIRDAADRAFGFLKQDPRHPSLHFKKVGRFWSVALAAITELSPLKQAMG